MLDSFLLLLFILRYFNIYLKYPSYIKEIRKFIFNNIESFCRSPSCVCPTRCYYYMIDSAISPPGLQRELISSLKSPTS